MYLTGESGGLWIASRQGPRDSLHGDLVTNLGMIYSIAGGGQFLGDTHAVRALVCSCGSEVVVLNGSGAVWTKMKGRRRRCLVEEETRGKVSSLRQNFPLWVVQRYRTIPKSSFVDARLSSLLRSRWLCQILRVCSATLRLALPVRRLCSAPTERSSIWSFRAACWCRTVQ